MVYIWRNFCTLFSRMPGELRPHSYYSELLQSTILAVNILHDHNIDNVHLGWSEMSLVGVTVIGMRLVLPLNCTREERRSKLLHGVKKDCSKHVCMCTHDLLPR